MKAEFLLSNAIAAARERRLAEIELENALKRERAAVDALVAVTQKLAADADNAVTAEHVILGGQS